MRATTAVALSRLVWWLYRLIHQFCISTEEFDLAVMLREIMNREQNVFYAAYV